MKRQKGRVSEVPREEIKITGDYGIVSKGEGRITTKQIETAIMTLKRTLPSGTRIRTRIQGHIAVSEKPLEVRMGKGKGGIAKRVARVRMNTVMIEIDKRGHEPEKKYEAGLRVMGTKLPVRYKIIKKRETEKGAGTEETEEKG
jgi:large subunit ribosomal protein L16